MTPQPHPFLQQLAVPAIVAFCCLIFAGCEKDIPTEGTRGPLDSSAKPPVGDPVVSSTDPTSAPQDTTLNIEVTGANFDSGSRVDLAIDGVPTDKVQTNSTTFVNSKRLIANVSIAADAIPDHYDVLVTTTKGKRGIGIELFEVTLSQGKTNPYTLTFDGDLEGTVSGMTLDYTDPLKQISAGGMSFRPVLASGDRSACRRINGGLVTATEWGAFAASPWLGSMDLARRGGGSFHLQLVGGQQDPDGGYINLVVNDTPVTDTVSPTGIAFTDFRNARALVSSGSWSDTDGGGGPVTDGDDRCINFTITAVPSAGAPQ